MTPYQQKRLISRIVHGSVGIVFVISGLIKGWHLKGFSGHLETLGLPLGDYAAPLAALLFWLELLLGSMLLSGFNLKMARYMSQVLLVIFIGYLGFLSLYGYGKPCGCFGPLITISPTVNAAFDALMFLALAWVEKWPVPAITHSLKRAFIFTAVLLLGVTLFGAKTTLFDPLILKLKPGFKMTSLPALTVQSNTANRDLLVVIMESPPTREELQRIQIALPSSEIILLDARGAIQGEIAGYPCIPAKASLISYYAHRYPTSFRIVDSEVTQVWYGKLPSSQ